MCHLVFAGIVTVPLLISGPFDGRFTSEEREYLIAAGLIVSGLLSSIQVQA
jgi:xanthine/uracil permease